MNQHKKTLMALAIISIVLPQRSKALDTEGNNLVNSIKIAYEANLAPSHILNPEKDLTTWKNALAKVNSYVKNNSSVMGIADSDLAKALAEVINTNSSLIAEIEGAKQARHTYLKNRSDYHNNRQINPLNLVQDQYIFTKQIVNYKGPETNRIKQLKTLRMNLDTTMAQLLAATFTVGVSNKENARDVLLAVIDYTQRAITAAIDKIGEAFNEVDNDKANMR